MPPKKSLDDSAIGKHHSITLEDKVAMIKRHEKGEKVFAISRSFGISRVNCFGKYKIV